MVEYTLNKKAGIGPCMDVRGWNRRIFAIQRQNGGRLCLLTPDLRPIYTYEGIGNVRQIEIKNGIAAISAREDGLWLFDVSGDEPLLLSHYRTVEFATGVTIYKNLVFISCRQYGVEIIDIKEPKEPRYVGVIRVGEVQSACVYENILYCGVWGKMKVVAIDISDIHAPRTVAEYPLSGRGDGVVVRDGMLYAATGQHRRGIKNVTDVNDPDFGMGNGVEVFDVTAPDSPRHILWEFFGKGHSLAFDMWKPMLCGELLLCNCSVMGVYGYDSRTMEGRFHILPPDTRDKKDPVTGTTVFEGRLYVTTGQGDLYCFDELEFNDAYRYDAKGTVETAEPNFECTDGGGVSLTQAYASEHPVLSVCEIEEGKTLALAMGYGGIGLIDPRNMQNTATLKTRGFCYDVKSQGALLCGAFGECGVAIYSLDGTAFTELSSITLGASVQQIAISENGRFLVAVCGSSVLKLLDICDPARPKVISTLSGVRGPFYGENLLTHPYGGKGISLFCHREGLIYTDPEGGDREFHTLSWRTKKGFMGYCPENGCDVVDGHILYARKGGYVILPADGDRYADELPIHSAKEQVSGKYCVVGKSLIATERAEGIVSVLDVSDIEHPAHIATLRTNASPSKAVSTDNGIYIAGRYGGLLKCDAGR